MKADAALKALSDRIGIFPEYMDLGNTRRPTSPETQRALLRANGLAVDTAAELRETLEDLEAEDADCILPPERILRSNTPQVLDLPNGTEWAVVLESGEQVAAGRSGGSVQLPSMPSGLHDLHLIYCGRAQTILLIASPMRLQGLETLGLARTWGVVGTIYGLKSERNFGLGDYADLGAIASKLGGTGAAYYGFNPVHALGWNHRDIVSPYSPSHRAFLNQAHLAPDFLADQCGCPSMQTEIALAGPAAKILRGGSTIDYSGHEKLLHPLLDRLFKFFESEASETAQAAFRSFCRDTGTPLADFALFETLSETHGPDWRSWPIDLQEVNDARKVHVSARRVKFHMWLQWLAHGQLEAAQRRALDAGMPLGLYLDLAVGARLGGAESWCERACIAEGVSVGAPPDHLSPAGQTWNLAAYAPRKLARHRYAPFRRVLARIMRYCGLLRIDHALGLARSYLVPDDGSPGGYIRQPFQTLAAIIAIEAERARSLVVGEDLGLVPDGFRDTLAEYGFYGYSVLQFEKTDGMPNDPALLRARSLACFGTHDTPTLRGYVEGVDIDWWVRLGWIDPESEPEKRAERAQEILAFRTAAPNHIDGAGLEGFRNAVHTTLAQSPAALVAVQLDDVLGERQAQNIPSTTTEHPNWLRRYSKSIKDIGSATELNETRAIMGESGRPAAVASGEAAT